MSQETSGGSAVAPAGQRKAGWRRRAEEWVRAQRLGLAYLRRSFPSGRLLRGVFSGIPTGHNLLSVRERRVSAQDDLCECKSDRRSKRFHLPNGRYDQGRRRTRSAPPESFAADTGSAKGLLGLGPSACGDKSRQLYAEVKPSLAAVVWPVARRQRSTPNWRATATMAFLRRRAPTFLLFSRMGSQRLTAWHWG